MDQPGPANGRLPQVDDGTTERRDREDKVLLPFWTSKEHRKRLKLLALSEDRTQQALLQEALDLLLGSRAVGQEPVSSEGQAP